VNFSPSNFFEELFPQLAESPRPNGVFQSEVFALFSTCPSFSRPTCSLIRINYAFSRTPSDVEKGPPPASLPALLLPFPFFFPRRQVLRSKSRDTPFCAVLTTPPFPPTPPPFRILQGGHASDFISVSPLFFGYGEPSRTFFFPPPEAPPSLLEKHETHAFSYIVTEFLFFFFFSIGYSFSKIEQENGVPTASSFPPPFF